MAGETKENVQCIGRFRLTVPEAMVVAGRNQSIYDVDVSTISNPPGGIKAFWDARLARIFPVQMPGEPAAANLRSFELKPGVPAVWYMGNPSAPRLRNLDAVISSGNNVVLAATTGEAGKESLIEDLLRIVINSFVQGTSQGFCVGEGAITSVPGLDEQTLISFDHKRTKDFDIRFETRTVAKPDTLTYSDLDEEKELMASAGGKLNVLRDHSRTVAGLEGKEMAFSASAPGEPASLRFTWHFPGVPQNSSKPMINIVGSAPVSQQAELEKIWDALLKSVQTVPPSPQRSR